MKLPKHFYTDGIPRYLEGAVWRRVEKKVVKDGELKHDDIGEYTTWKDKRVYVKFKV